MSRTVGILLLMMVGFPILSSAQFVAGGKFISGTINYSVSADPDVAVYGDSEYIDRFSVSPSFAFIVSDKIASGIRASYGRSFVKVDGLNYSTETNDYSVGLFATRFFPLGGDKFWFTISAGADYGRSKSDIGYGGSTFSIDTESYFVTVTLRPGFVYFLNERWAATMSVGNFFWTHTHEIGSEDTENVVSANLGSVGLGIQYFFK